MNSRQGRGHGAGADIAEAHDERREETKAKTEEDVARGTKNSTISAHKIQEADPLAAKFSTLAGTIVGSAPIRLLPSASGQDPRENGGGDGGGKGTGSGVGRVRERGRSRDGGRDERPPWGRGGNIRVEALATFRPSERERTGDGERELQGLGSVHSRRRSASAGRAQSSLGRGGEVASHKERGGQDGRTRRSAGAESLSRSSFGAGMRGGRVASWEVEESGFDDGIDNKGVAGDSGKGAGIGKSGGVRMHERLTLSSISKMTPRRQIAASPPGHLELGHL